MDRLNGLRSQRSLFSLSALALTIFSIDARGAMIGARITVTGTTNATTVGTVTNQTAGSPTLFAATDPSNTGDITLRLGNPTTAGGGTGFTQANGVIIATPNQFQYSEVGARNMIEAPGELTNATAGFFQNIYLSTTRVAGGG